METQKPGKPIDVLRCLRGMKNINVDGNPDQNRGGRGTDGGTRNHLIEEVIASIIKDGDKALKDGYVGFKNYAGFGDQRCDCDYGMGPSHGYMVFEIERTREARDKGVRLGADEIYLLECVRDFGSTPIPEEKGKESDWNLIKVIKKAESLRHDLIYFDGYLVGARVDEQCAIEKASHN